MRHSPLIRLLALCLLLPTVALADPTTQPATQPVSQDPNELILRIANSYTDGGGYRRNWGGGSGSPDAIRHGGVTILKADTGGTYCCGYTLAVVVRAMNELNLLEGKTPEQLKRFQKLWYGATAEDRERLVSFAVEDLGVGREVPADEAKAGDFLQLWRTNKSGHSVIFLGWLTDDQGRRIGIRYRSSQGSTDGIGDTTEKFVAFGGRVMPSRLYFARLGA